MTIPFKVSRTGLPDGEYATQVEIGQEFTFYNGHMSRYDGKRCKVTDIRSEHKFIVKFDDGHSLLAYNTELKK